MTVSALQLAELLGFDVRLDAGRLVITGPAADAWLGERLLEERDAVVAVLSTDWARATDELGTSDVAPPAGVVFDDVLEASRRGWSKREADMLAFGGLVFALLARGVDVKTTRTTRPPLTVTDDPIAHGDREDVRTWEAQAP